MWPETLFKLKAIIQALWVCLQASNIKLTESNMMYLFANQSAIYASQVLCKLSRMPQMASRFHDKWKPYKPEIPDSNK